MCVSAADRKQSVIMDQARPLLYVSLGFVLLLLWQSWTTFTDPTPSPISPVTPSDSSNKPQKFPEDLPASVTSEQPRPAELEQNVTQQVDSPTIEVRTDVLSMTISTRGGDVIRADLSKIPVHLGDPTPYHLFHYDAKGSYLMQAGLLHDHLPDMSGTLADYAPSHHARYNSASAHYQMTSEQDELHIPLVWQGQGIEVKKVFIFRRGRYLIDIEHWVRNNRERAWVGRQYTQLRRSDEAPENENRFLYTFTGAAYYDGTYTKQGFADIVEEPMSQAIHGGWAAMLEHYFVSAVVPDQTQAHDYYSKSVSGNAGAEYIIGIRSPALTIAPWQEERFHTQLYVGPKLQRKLEHIAPGLELTTDYGIFTVISKPLFWLLERIYQYLRNWGWSIIMLTLLIKLVFYKLSEVGYRSMARMRKFQPQLTRLRERYKDDRQRMNQEMMGLYRKEKINPLGGCFPILVQIPVFIALYWVLLESVELRQAPFVLWIQDLSAKDPYFVLPVLMGISMFLQNRLNPTPPDPIQAKVMMFLPFIFTVFFAFFPAGLVLYWLANNVLSIAQQWMITRRIERAVVS